MSLVCEQCGCALEPRFGGEVAPGDVFEVVSDITRSYDWLGSKPGTLCTLPKGTRVIAIDQHPPGWWKVAIHARRFRVVADPDLVLYPDLHNGDYVRVAGTCHVHLSPIVDKVRRVTEWWRR